MSDAQTVTDALQDAAVPATPPPAPSQPDAQAAPPAVDAAPPEGKEGAQDKPPATADDLDKLFASLSRRKAKVREAAAKVEAERRRIEDERKAIETARAENARTAELQRAIAAGDFDKVEELLGADAYDAWTKRRLSGGPPAKAAGEKSEVEKLRDELAQKERQREFEQAFAAFRQVAADEARYPDVADMSEAELREHVPLAASALAQEFGRPPTYEEIATAVQRVRERQLERTRARWQKTAEQKLREQIEAEVRKRLEAEFAARAPSTLTSRTGASDGARAAIPDDPEERERMVLKNLEALF